MEWDDERVGLRLAWRRCEDKYRPVTDQDAALKIGSQALLEGGLNITSIKA